MKIIGIGTDIVNIKRVEKILKQNKAMFLKKIFTNKEISLIRHFNSNISSKIAMRFAAKEAFAKSIGTGIGEELSFLDFEVLNKKSGQPYIQSNMQKLKKMKFNLSMSDDYPWAIAFVIATK